MKILFVFTLLFALRVYYIYIYVCVLIIILVCFHYYFIAIAERTLHIEVFQFYFYLRHCLALTLHRVQYLIFSILFHGSTECIMIILVQFKWQVVLLQFNLICIFTTQSYSVPRLTALILPIAVFLLLLAVPLFRCASYNRKSDATLIGYHDVLRKQSLKAVVHGGEI